ncbi:MAG: InlB B-repeat-containing protein [Paludibacteraceae bacterium]|nr:InlB B-repeat-containing protein [Paludibacteraceae bacterium]
MRHSFYRIGIIFALLITMGAGQMWAGNRRIYFDYSLVTMWDDYTNLSGGAGFACVHCWGGKEGDADYTMSVVEGESYLACCDIDEGWTNVCFYRKGSDGSWWTKTFDYNSFGSKNYFKIKNESEKDGGIDKYKWDSATRWAPGVCIDGLIDLNNPHNQAFDFDDNDGTYEVTLSAHTTYQFCIRDGSTRYTLDNNVWSGTIPGYTLGTTGYDIRLATAGAGTYKFEYNKSTHVMKVTYPTVNHPNIDYCYLYKFNDWTHHYLHIYDSESSIEGTTYPGTEIENYFEIGDDKYYYFAPGDYANCQPNDNNDSRKVNPAASTSAGLGKFQKYITDSWGWRTFTVRIQLNDLTPTTRVDPTYMDVAFNSDVLSDLTTVPTKTHYDFGGFYTGYDEVNEEVTGVQVINAAGEWIASVDDYTDASKHWIHAGMSTTLYAKWTEHPYDITLAVDPSSSPAGGSIQIGGVTQTSVNAYYVTETAEITAVPSNAAWRFKEWRFSKTGEDFDVYVSPGHEYSSTSNPITIKAEHDGTLTAVFEPRFYLVGVLYSTGEAGGGMPGWESASEYRAPFEVTSNSPLTATCTRQLDPNTTFKFLVRNRDNGLSYGYATSGTHIEDGDALLMNTADGHVYLDSKGYGNYTFTISDVTLTDGVYYPTVSVSGPTSYQLELKRAYVKVDGAWYKDVDDAGGTVSAQTTESGHNFTITSGQYVAEGGSITYTATPTTPGFTFRGWYNNDYGYRISTENPYTSSNIRALEHFEGKFTEDTIDVTIANDGHGYVQINGSTVTAAKVGVITTREITAVPHPGYMFSHWTVPDGKNFNVSSTTSATTTLSGLGSGSDGTLTATFEPRYELRGSDMNGVDTSVGMSGWTTGTPLTGTTSIEPSGSEDIPVNLTCTCTLHPNKEYKFSIHDRTPNRNYGPSSNLSLLNSGDDMLLNTENNNVKIATVGYGTYIFKITKLSRTNYYPTVTVERQASHTLTLGVNNDSYGSVSAQTNEGGGGGFAITNGQFFATGSDITFTASPSAGYYVEGWYSNAECTTAYDGDASDVTIGSNNLTLTLSSINGNKTVYAKFAKIWSVYLNLEHTYWSTYAKTDGDDIYTFDIDLPANTQYTFTINDNGAGSVYKKDNTQIYYMTYGNSSNWDGFATDKTKECGIKTAGKGTYTFTWNATDKVLSVTYPTSYTVTFGYGTGGSAVTATVDEVAITSGQYVTSDKAISFTKTAATGYTFKGWYDAASDGTAISYMASDDVYDKIEGNISVYAQFTANTYTIEYDANDAQYYGAATGSTTSSSHTYDEAKNLTSNGFSRAGFDFAGWNTAADGSGSSYTNGQSVTNLSATQDETVTLYARWTAHELTITLDDNGGSGGSPASLTAVYGRTAKADGGGMFDGITDPTRTGYTFGGWWTNTDGTGTEIITSAHFYHWTTDYVDKDGKWKYDGNVTAYAKWTPVALTFTGATDSDWGTASNWSPECVPTLGHDVTIQAPVLVAADHATAKSIVLDQNSHTGKLTIQANKGLEVAGTITRTTDGSNRLATRLEDLILESSSAGNASLIFNNSNACQATVMMYSKATIVGNTWNWQYVGTPFTGSIPLYNYYGSWMYKWNNGSWEVVHGGDELTPFAGYCLTQNSATTHVMGGTLVPTTSKSVTMAASTDMVLANSWTAPISIASFDIEGSDATFTSTPATVYLFNTGMAEDGSEEGTEAGTYISVPINSATYTGNGLIAPMQGFFVTTNGVGGTSGSITLNYNDLVRPAGNHTDIVAGPMKMRKQEETKPDVMKIRANGALYNDRVVILAREDFSDGFDNGWDGEKMSFGEVAPSVYVINEQGGYDAVSAIPSFEGTVVGFRAGANNSCTMSFEYDGDETLYLNDLQAQMSTLISEENNYTFTTSAGDSEVRFIISATPIQKVPTGIEHSVVSGQPSEVRKLIINDHVYIIRSGRMYGVDGQMIK